MSLTKKHGSKKGREIYYRMESEGKASFKKALATAKRRKHVLGLKKKKGKPSLRKRKH